MVSEGEAPSGPCQVPVWALTERLHELGITWEVRSKQLLIFQWWPGREKWVPKGNSKQKAYKRLWKTWLHFSLLVIFYYYFKRNVHTWESYYNATWSHPTFNFPFVCLPRTWLAHAHPGMFCYRINLQFKLLRESLGTRCFRKHSREHGKYQYEPLPLGGH